MSVALQIFLTGRENRGDNCLLEFDFNVSRFSPDLHFFKRNFYFNATFVSHIFVMLAFFRFSFPPSTLFISFYSNCNENEWEPGVFEG